MDCSINDQIQMIMYITSYAFSCSFDSHHDANIVNPLYLHHPCTEESRCGISYRFYIVFKPRQMTILTTGYLLYDKDVPVSKGGFDEEL